ncbi:MAG: DNA-formamidopyrimidine glycosylase [Bacilli bacterium]|nr:DNA-formamidopyrimidine glycosylase [Bacilli bacterium]
MPEIAEVETVRNTLKNRIIGKEVKQVIINYAPIIESDEKEFKRILPGLKITDIKRVGKWLIFELENYCLLSHLRMEGKYFLKSSEDPIIKHEHIIFEFTDSTNMRYHDTRKFGRMILVPKEKLFEVEAIKKQGYEPNSKELTKEYLFEKIKKKNLPIKTILLDQTIISGLGNIYANEVLFKAKINPQRVGKDITIEECERIKLSSNEIIKKAIEDGGTTIRSYTSSLGVTGLFQTKLMVHKKEGEPCKICGTPIENIKIGGRSTYYCPKCQK